MRASLLVEYIGRNGGTIAPVTALDPNYMTLRPNSKRIVDFTLGVRRPPATRQISELSDESDSPDESDFPNESDSVPSRAP